MHLPVTRLLHKLVTMATKLHSKPDTPGSVGEGSTISGAHTATATALASSRSSLVLLTTAAAVEV